jgi:hypothetical protein
MQPFHAIPNAAEDEQADRPLMQKDRFAVSEPLLQYLYQYQRVYPFALRYPQLLHYRYTDAIRDKNGRHTHWEKVTYPDELWLHLLPELLHTGRLLLQKPDLCKVIAIDFCEYANSMPFRITMADDAGAVYLYYIKWADASRVYGLELEHLLSNNTISYLYQEHTLIEAHIDGTPGDDFIPLITTLTPTQKKELAQAFVAFNEACFVRLLGDMRSYNFVQLGSQSQTFHFRALDFDNQCSEGSLNFYFPQFYKENYAYVQLVKHTLSYQQIEECRLAQRNFMANQMQQNSNRIKKFIAIMANETLADSYKIIQLQQQLNAYHNTLTFSLCKTMGQLLQKQLQILIGL